MQHKDNHTRMHRQVIGSLTLIMLCSTAEYFCYVCHHTSHDFVLHTYLCRNRAFLTLKHSLAVAHLLQLLLHTLLLLLQALCLLSLLFGFDGCSCSVLLLPQCCHALLLWCLGYFWWGFGFGGWFWCCSWCSRDFPNNFLYSHAVFSQTQCFAPHV